MSVSEGCFFFIENSVDPYEMQHYAAFYLGLHDLLKYPYMGFKDFQYKRAIASTQPKTNHLRMIMFNSYSRSFTGG